MAFGSDDWNALLRALRNVEDIDGAVAAAQRLHKESTHEDVPRLRELLQDSDAFREAAAWPLSELLGPPALRELFVAYQRGLNEGFDNDGFTTALIELVSADALTCAEVLRHLATDADPNMRENALWLLEFCKPQA